MIDGIGRQGRSGGAGVLRRRCSQALLTLTLGLGLTLALFTGAAPPAEAVTAKAALLERQQQWPTWSLPAPLPRPGRSDLVLPEWMLGTWELREAAADSLGARAETTAGSSGPVANAAAGQQAETPEGEGVTVRFLADGRGRVVGDRAFNALNLGRSVLGDSLLGVENDPANPNRQLARLRGDRLLESTVIGRGSLRLNGEAFLADELTLQILHGPGQPQVSQVEVLALYRRLGQAVTIEQWQASYAGPGGGGEGRHSSHRLLDLQPVQASPHG